MASWFHGFVVHGSMVSWFHGFIELTSETPGLDCEGGK